MSFINRLNDDDEFDTDAGVRDVGFAVIGLDDVGTAVVGVVVGVTVVGTEVSGIDDVGTAVVWVAVGDDDFTVGFDDSGRDVVGAVLGFMVGDTCVDVGLRVGINVDGEAVGVMITDDGLDVTVEVGIVVVCCDATRDVDALDVGLDVIGIVVGVNEGVVLGSSDDVAAAATTVRSSNRLVFSADRRRWGEAGISSSSSPARIISVMGHDAIVDRQVQHATVMSRSNLILNLMEELWRYRSAAEAGSSEKWILLYTTRWKHDLRCCSAVVCLPRRPPSTLPCCLIFFNLVGAHSFLCARKGLFSVLYHFFVHLSLLLPHEPPLLYARIPRNRLKVRQFGVLFPIPQLAFEGNLRVKE